MSTAEKQALHAQKVAQKVAEYHPKLAAPSRIGLFSKLEPKIRARIYSSLFEDVLQPEESDTLCPCRLTPGECGHSGQYAYKPLKHLHPFLALLATCKLFRNEALPLLYVDYIPKTAWVVRGKDGPEQLKSFLRCIRPQQPEKMLFAWRIEDEVTDSVQIKGAQANRLDLWMDGAANWLSSAIDSHDHVNEEEGKALCAEAQNIIDGRSPLPDYSSSRHLWYQDEGIPSPGMPRQKEFGFFWSTRRFGGYSTKRFYIGHKYHPPADRETVVVNGPLYVLSLRSWEMVELKKATQERYDRIVRM